MQFELLYDDGKISDGHCLATKIGFELLTDSPNNITEAAWLHAIHVTMKKPQQPGWMEPLLGQKSRWPSCKSVPVSFAFVWIMSTKLE